MIMTGRKKEAGAIFLLMGIFILMSAFSVRAAGQEPHTDSWVRRNGYAYYFDLQGKKAVGLCKIHGHMYLFDKCGHQKHGWQKVGRSFCFFRYKCGKQGYMLRGRTVNHIPLRKNGRAAVGASNPRMALLWRCSKIVEKHTRPAWSRARKMRAVWSWFQSNIGYSNLSFHLSGDWDVYYASLTFSRGWGSCEGLGYAWAFLANACGAGHCCSVSDTGHGWAEVDGKVYDPACARYDRARDSYYAMPMSLSGVGGRPNYARNGMYRKWV